MKQAAVALGVVAALALALCLILPRAIKSPPERALDRMITALEKGKVKKAEKYTTAQLGLQSNRRAKKLYKAMYKDMSYAVTDLSIDGDSATITISVTMVGMETLLADASLEELSRSLDGKRNYRRYYKQLVKRIKAGEGDKTTTLSTVRMVKEEDGWKVDVQNSKKLRYALTGGMLSS